MPEIASLRAPREALASRIERLDAKGAKPLASFVRSRGDDGSTPCWGAIAARFDELFENDADRLELLESLLAEGDRRALLVFLHRCRSRARVLEALCTRAAALPPSVQRALVAMPEAATAVAAHLASFEPAAAEVWGGGEATKRPERELFEARVAELTAVPFLVPDVADPREERLPKAPATPLRRLP